jgi:hypothetical protein
MENDRTDSFRSFFKAFVLVMAFGCMMFGASLLRRHADAQAAPPPVQTVQGATVTWKLPGVGWTTYEKSNISRFGVDVDDCVQNQAMKATLCVHALDAKKTGAPVNAITALFDKFDVDMEDRPRVLIKGTQASFTFALGEGLVSSALDIKVQADIAPQRRDKVLMVMAAWGAGSVPFTAADIDAIARDIRLK